MPFKLDCTAALKQKTRNIGLIMKRKPAAPDSVNSPAAKSKSAPTARSARTPQKVTPEYLRSLGHHVPEPSGQAFVIVGMPNPKLKKG
jgi:hypothetical protein